jgi:[ribosomal protein S5]-alanine N-acetyltransferase
VQPIETKRLRLRLLTPADADFILELVNEPAWLRYIGDKNVRSRGDAETYIAQRHEMYRKHGVCVRAVELKNSGTAIGTCGLIKRDHLPHIDLGYAFLERFRGQGYAHEAAIAVLQFGYTVLKLPRIVALTHPENAASIGLLKKLGFAFDSSAYRADGTIETHLFTHVRDRMPQADRIDDAVPT